MSTLTEYPTDLRLWLPTSVKEMKLRGWEQPDVILFTGDAYVDHPSFGAMICATSRSSGVRDSSLECRPEPWTRWSTTILPTAAAAVTTPIRREANTVCVPTIPQ